MTSPHIPALSWQALVAAMLVTFVLGSVHAFSVLLVPLETLLSVPRAQVSLLYSFALVAITLAVTLGYLFYSRAPAWAMIVLTGLVAASGLWLASIASSWWLMLCGYSIAFGFANGVGYGYCLQLAGQLLPGRRGIGMGSVTAAYALGSIVFARLMAWRIEVDSVRSALSLVAVAVLLAAALAAIAMYRANTVYSAAPGTPDASPISADRRRLLQFWLAYLSGVFAGLMAIGHAAGIAGSRPGGEALASWAAVIVGVGSALGGFAAGGLVDRWPLGRFLVGLPLLSAIALLGIGFVGDIASTLLLLGLAGFAYGSIIAIYPVAIAAAFGAGGARAYGRVFIAWGTAGLLAPWCAGLVFDISGDYRIAMVIAASVALVSAGCARLFRLGETG